MPRPIIGVPKRESTETSRANASARSASKSRHGVHQLGLRLREKRSPAYLEGIRRLDAGQHLGNRDALESLLDAISEEFSDLGIDERPLGIVGRCYLGAPFEVHVCDLSGSILEHYEIFRALPAPFANARPLAVHPGYMFVEVYSDCLRAVAADGSVSVMPV